MFARHKKSEIASEITPDHSGARRAGASKAGRTVLNVLSFLPAVVSIFTFGAFEAGSIAIQPVLIAAWAAVTIAIGARAMLEKQNVTKLAHGTREAAFSRQPGQELSQQQSTGKMPGVPKMPPNIATALSHVNEANVAPQHGLPANNFAVSCAGNRPYKG